MSEFRVPLRPLSPTTWSRSQLKAERQQTVSLYRSDYRPQSGPSQTLQTSCLTLFPSSWNIDHFQHRRQWTQRTSLFLEFLKFIRDTFPRSSFHFLHSSLLLVFLSHSFISFYYFFFFLCSTESSKFSRWSIWLFFDDLTFAVPRKLFSFPLLMEIILARRFVITGMDSWWRYKAMELDRAGKWKKLFEMDFFSSRGVF